MPHLTVPDDNFERLAATAAALNISVDDLVRPVLDQLAATAPPTHHQRNSVVVGMRRVSIAFSLIGATFGLAC
jgi:hypothetical protein